VYNLDANPVVIGRNTSSVTYPLLIFRTFIPFHLCLRFGLSHDKSAAIAVAAAVAIVVILGAAMQNNI
jgi:hypothetical protein